MALDFTQPVFVISVAAELADMHPRPAAVTAWGWSRPPSIGPRARRYSQLDVEKLRQIQNCPRRACPGGIKRIMQLENQVRALRSRVGAVGGTGPRAGITP